MSGQRYILQPSQTQGWHVATDTRYGIVCRFEDHRFNETQKFTPLDDDAMKRLAPQQIAGVMREMAEWLTENHYELIF